MGLLLKPAGDRLHLEIDRGDDQTLRLTVRDYTGALLDISAASAKCTVKRRIDDAIGSAIFQLTNPQANGIDLSQGAAGICDVIFSDAILASMSGSYWYDVELIVSGNVRTIVPTSSFFVRKDISDVGSPPAPPVPVVPFPGDIQVQGGFIYLKDTGAGAFAGLYWKIVIRDGTFDLEGPSSTVPF